MCAHSPALGGAVLGTPHHRSTAPSFRGPQLSIHAQRCWISSVAPSRSCPPPRDVYPPLQLCPVPQVCGVALVAIGIYAHVALNKALVAGSSSAASSPVAIMVVGIIIFFVSFFGCCGAWKESYCMVTTVSGGGGGLGVLGRGGVEVVLIFPPLLTHASIPAVRRSAQHHLPGGDRRCHRRLRLQG